MTQPRFSALLILVTFSTSLLAPTAPALAFSKDKDIPAECNPGRIEDIDNVSSSADAGADGGEVLIDPSYLRQRLLGGNIGVLVGLNRLHRAKNELTVARASLLPSINVGTLLLAPVSPAFALASVEFLLPFLVPSNWFKERKAKDLLKAERASFRALQLNAYASAYSIYLTLLGDQDLLQSYQDEVKDLADIEDTLRRAEEVGLADVETVERAHAQTELSRVGLSKTAELMAQETASLRSALGLSSRARITLLPVEVPASEFEGRPVEDIASEAFNRAPEREQLGNLLDAAHQGKWEKAFAFIGSFGIKGATGPDGSSPFSNMKTSSQENLGFASFAALRLSSRDADDIKLQVEELRRGTSRVLESAQASVVEAKSRVASASSAEASLRKVYESRLAQFELGMAGAVPALLARSLLRQAALEATRARIALAQARVVFHRAFISDQFAQIQGCSAEF